MDSRPVSTQKAPEVLPVIKGSTAKILVELYKRSMKFDHISSDDPTLKRCAILEANTAQAQDNLQTNPKINHLHDTIGANLERMRAADQKNPAMQSRTSGFNSENQELIALIAKLKAERDKLLVDSKKLITRQHEAAASLMIAVSIETTPTARILSTLSTLEADLKNFANQTANFKNQEKNAVGKLEKLSNSIAKNMHDLVPAEQRIESTELNK